MSATPLVDTTHHRCPVCHRRFRENDHVTLVLKNSYTRTAVDHTIEAGETETVWFLCAEMDWKEELVYHFECYEIFVRPRSIADLYDLVDRMKISTASRVALRAMIDELASAIDSARN